MYMNVSIHILFVAHPRHNMRQLLGRKIFRQFFQLPLTSLQCKLVWTELGKAFSKSDGFMEKTHLLKVCCSKLTRFVEGTQKWTELGNCTELWLSHKCIFRQSFALFVSPNLSNVRHTVPEDSFCN